MMLERSLRTTACRRARHPASRLVLPPVVQRGGHRRVDFLLMARGATTTATAEAWAQDLRGAARTRAVSRWPPTAASAAESRSTCAVAGAEEKRP